jgi:hypothetical protein
MTHQRQTLKLIDRSIKRRKIPKYAKFVFGIIFIPGLFGLILGILLKEITLRQSIPFAGAFIFIALVLALTSTSLNDKNADFDTESILLEENQITYRSKKSTSNIEIPIQKVLKITIEYFGIDEGPQHWINYSRHKTGGNNFLTIQNVDGTILKREFYCQNENEIKRLRNNLDYYKIKGVESIILNKKHNH